MAALLDTSSEFGSAERFSAMFSVPLLFRATRIRGSWRPPEKQRRW
jgi:hypothetical protein